MIEAEQRQLIATALQDAAALTDETAGSVLIGWVAVAEFMDGDGARWLIRTGAPADPEQSLPVWQREGYLHNALCGEGWGNTQDRDADDQDPEET